MEGVQGGNFSSAKEMCDMRKTGDGRRINGSE